MNYISKFPWGPAELSERLSNVFDNADIERRVILTKWANRRAEYWGCDYQGGDTLEDTVAVALFGSSVRQHGTELILCNRSGWAGSVGNGSLIHEDTDLRELNSSVGFLNKIQPVYFDYDKWTTRLKEEYHTFNRKKKILPQILILSSSLAQQLFVIFCY